ncbi:MAG: hypothetical protein RL339_2624 [Pseudomonadota bacterium]|jgi:ABC-type phosphate/phosphonate transport system permease subunit
MGIVLGLIVFVLLPAALSWGICSGMRVLSPVSSRRRRVAIGAAFAGFLPILVPLLSVLDVEFPEGLIAIVAILLAGVLMALLIGLPVAIRATRNDFPA